MDVEITELELIDADRVDGVGMPANGIPILMLKAVAPEVAKAGHGPFTGTHSHAHDADGAQGDDGEHEHSHSHDGDADHGHSHAAKAEFDRGAALELVKAIVGRKVDETPDIAGGTAVLAQIADLIIAEAQELKAGNAGEICDIQQLACAAEMIWCWRTGEEAVSTGSVMPATALMQSAAKAAESTASQNDLPDSAFAYIESGGKKDAEGKTTPRSLRHFPVHDAAHARNALARASQSPFGEKAMPKIRAAAKKFGIDAGDDTSKSQIADEGTTVDTDAQDTGGLLKAVEEAVAKATAPLEKLRKELEEAVAKVKATPVPGGPVLSRNVQVKTPGGVDEGTARKAALYRAKAEAATSPQDRDGYLALARETEQQAKISS